MAHLENRLALRLLPLALLLLSAAGVGCGDATDPRPASWAYVSAAIMQPNCATTSCHSRAAAVSGLDFSSPDHGFVSLTGLWVWIVDPLGTAAGGCRKVGGTVVCQREHRPLVVPFDPDQSRLIHMLRAENAPRMPPDRPLSRADIRLVETWILHGALAANPDGPDAGDAAAMEASGSDESVADVGFDTDPDDSAVDAGDGDQSSLPVEAGK